jgi:predicted DNA-binding transcriptional regulator YafY
MRYSFIIHKLRTSKRASYEDISAYLEQKSNDTGYDFVTSRRTFARDIEDIASIYGIEIEYSFPMKCYYIKNESDPDGVRMLEIFDMYQALQMHEHQSPFVHLEKRCPQGTEHIFGLLHAMKNHLQVTFGYQKYYQEHSENRVVAPMTLKEFKSRWYLFAKDSNDKKVKCYGLDRIFNLEILNVKFVDDECFDIDQYLKHCFGIISPNADTPSEIILSFDSFQGKYIKSLPLHETQEIVSDTEDELRIRLTLYITHDFLMELLSHGDTVKVIKPKHLADTLKNIYARALEQYV